MAHIRSSVITITPEAAGQWLARGGTNRRLKSHVDKIRDDILAGRWFLNGQAIILDRDGRVLDGQHRLRACVMAGLPIESVVVFNADPAGFDTIDTGAARSAADLISIDGTKNAALVAAATRILTWYDNHYEGDLNGFAGKLSSTLIRRNAAQYGKAGLYAIVSNIKARSGLARIFPVSPLSALIFVASREGYGDLAAKFLEDIETGANLPAGDAALALRNRVISAKARGERIMPQSMFGLMLKSWTAYVKNDPVKLVRIGLSERAPKFVGRTKAA